MSTIFPFCVGVDKQVIFERVYFSLSGGSVSCCVSVLGEGLEVVE